MYSRRASNDALRLISEKMGDGKSGDNNRARLQYVPLKGGSSILHAAPVGAVLGRLGLLQGQAEVAYVVAGQVDVLLNDGGGCGGLLRRRSVSPRGH